MAQRKSPSKKAGQTVPVQKEKIYDLRGANGDLWNSVDPEVMLSGPSDTGKSVTCCMKLHAACVTVPGVQCVMARKTYNSIAGSVFQTYNRLIQPRLRGIEVFGGENRPERLIYQNGSVVWLAGLDDPGKALSSERDLIYVCQAEQLTLNDWEMLTTRASGRGAKLKHTQVIGDCNPGGSRHWIRARALAGKMRLLVTRHQDNPELYDEQGNITDEGKRRIAVLDNLSGVRLLRLRDGVWATAEGAVFDMFNANVTGQPSDHVQVKPVAGVKRWFVCQDEGYTNPAAVLLCGDDSDGRRHVFREWYERGKVESECVAAAWLMYSRPVMAATGVPWAELEAAPLPELKCELAAVDDAAASLIAALKAKGVNAIGGKGRILDGIKLVQDRFKVQGDGRPRLTIDPSCVNLINELESHVWRPEKNTQKDEPLDRDNHAIAALRYLEDVLAVPTGEITAGMVSGLSTGNPTFPQHGGGRHWPGGRSWGG